jgi:hypothetical protein
MRKLIGMLCLLARDLAEAAASLAIWRLHLRECNRRAQDFL